MRLLLIRSVKTWHDSLRSLLRLARAWLLLHNLLPCISDWIVPFMGWNLHMLSLFTCENIKSTVAFIIHVFGADQSTHPSIVLHLSQLLSLCSWIVVQTDQVICCPALVLLAGVKVVSFSRDHLLLLYIITLHIFKSLDLSLKSLLSQMSILVHIVLISLLSDLGVGH